jgi:RNA polymerase sigma factor (sigma-70 family)
VWRISRSVERDDEALTRRLERLRNSLSSWFTRRTGDPAEAQDLVQESFLRVTQRPNASELEHLEGYVYRVAANILTDRHRRRAVRQASDHVDLDEAVLLADGLDPHRDLAARRELKKAADALDKLPERTRTIFILRRLEGLRFKEIARRFGISVSAVEKHMARAIEALGSDMEGWR